MGVRDSFVGRLVFGKAELKVAGDVVPIGIQGRPQYPSTDIESLQTAYTRNEIVYAAISAKSSAAVGPRLLVQTRVGGGEWEEIEGHPLRRLIMRPNPLMDEAAFTKAYIASMDIAGVFFAEIVRDKGTGLPSALYPLNPAKVTIIPGTGPGGVAGYKFKDGGDEAWIPPENMLVDRSYNPLNRWWGLAPLAVALGSVDADNAQTDYIRAFFDNGGVVSGLLKLKRKFKSQAEADEIRAKWRSRFGRASGGQHDVGVLDEDAEYEQIGTALDKLQGDTLREFTETRVSMAFQVPPLIIYAFAGLKRATYSNLKEAWRGFWDGTLTPLFSDYKSWLTWNLLIQFVPQDLIFAEKVRLAWDFSEVPALQEDRKDIEERARENLKAGGITLNEFRAIIGEQPDQAGDYYIRSIAQIAEPVGQAAAAQEPASDAGDQAQAGKALSRPEAIKALRAAGLRKIERQIETEVRDYLGEQYRAAAEAVRRNGS